MLPFYFTSMFLNLISKNKPKFTPVIDSRFNKDDYTLLDLSSTNRELNEVDLSNAFAVQNYIDKVLSKDNSKVAYGGYLEVRDIYKRSEYFNQPTLSNDERNIHLGVDIWAKAGTAVLTPLDGIVHSFNNNTNHGDYGPTIVLKHHLQGVCFYTLYGHLSIGSINSLSVGQKFEGNSKIAELGDSSVNGDYAPHLHFQVILDMQDKKGDYPGVCSQNNVEFYKRNCPDPMLLLNIES